jgi:hypothetical protein
MILPLPKSFSIFDMAACSAFSFSLCEFVASLGFSFAIVVKIEVRGER